MSGTIKMKDVFAEDVCKLVTEACSEIDWMRKTLDRESILLKLRKMNYADEVIDAAFKLYEEKNPTKMTSSVLKGEKYKSRLNWYSPVENPDPNSRWGKLISVLKSKFWHENSIKTLGDQSNDVVSCLASPKSKEPQLVKGLVLGYVQSGKTANFSATIAKAADEGYRLVIVLSGLHNALRNQTEKRLRAELVDPHAGRRSFNLTDMGQDGDFHAQTNSPNSFLNNKDKFTLLVMKKNATSLARFSEWIQTTDDEIMGECPVLIIDDEADQASIDNSRNNNPTKINELIRKMLNFFASKTICSYVGYTATPFANILINAQEKEDLFPSDFIVALESPEDYCGTEKLFGRASVDMDGGESGLDLIRYIDPVDVIVADDQDVKDRLPKSLRVAIQSFLLAAGERIRRKQLRKHITMLIHTSHLRDQHTAICGIAERFLSEIKLFIEQDNADLKKELIDIWETDFTKNGKRDFPAIQIGDFSTVYEGIKYFVNSLVIVKENSESESRLDFDLGKPVWAIIVGGNVLSRGLTIEGLTVSYFHRTTDGYDTLLQMGRWFGFRPDYLDLVRVFVTQQMQSHFYHIATVEQELRGDIERMWKNEERPIDIALKIRDHDFLSITNKQVLRKNGTLASNSYSATKLQASHLFINNKKFADKNLKAVKNLLQSMEKAKLRSEIKFPLFKRCLLYKNVSVKDIISFLESYVFSDADKKFRIELLGKYITSLVEKGELTNWSVAMMSTRQTSDEKRIALGENIPPVFAVDRRYSSTISIDSDKFGVVVKNITVVRDELIDLDDVPEIDLKFLETDDELKGSAVPYRNQRPPTRPLLLIYPIYTHWNLSPEKIAEVKRGELFEPVVCPFENLFGVTIVFPPTRQERFEFNYITNASIGQ